MLRGWRVLWHPAENLADPGPIRRGVRPFPCVEGDQPAPDDFYGRRQIVQPKYRELGGIFRSCGRERDLSHRREPKTWRPRATHTSAWRDELRLPLKVRRARRWCPACVARQTLCGFRQ